MIRFKRLFSFFFTIVSIVVIIGVSRSLYTLWYKRDIVSERKQELESLKRKHEDLKQKLEETQSVEFVERQARESLGMIKEGETIVIVPSRESSAKNWEKTEALSNRERWWKLFF